MNRERTRIVATGAVEASDDELRMAVGGTFALSGSSARPARGGGDVAMEELTIAYEGFDLD